MTRWRHVRMGASCAVILFALCSVATTAGAQDLTPDTGDPNAPPPPPPAMPEPGTPGSATPPPPPGSTAATLDRSSKEDTGVGLHFVYIQPEIGVGWATLGSTIPDDKSDFRSGAGPVFGVGAGGEFISFQAGARLRVLSTPNFNLWTVGGELAYQPGSGRFWPRIGVGVGYVWGNKFPVESCGAQCGNLDINGIDAGLRAGLQYYITSNIEIGADLGLDALFLKRRGINVGASGTSNASLTTDQSSTGFLAVALVHLGFHYP